ncbi:TrkA family potassium uptake protein [Candidatus Peregrinibacteria bacterium]|nr:TrkA family potassium uptake protein [Candidatus Peregrinibacteria bacterium]
MRTEQHFWRKISGPALVFIGMMVITIIGFYLTENWSPLQGYYAFIRTAFGDWFDTVVPESTQGKLFATLINIFSIVAAGYFFATLSALFVEGELKDIIKFKKMDKSIADLKDHFIICGIDNVSRHIIDEFIKTNTPFVVIEPSTEACQKLEADYKFLYIDDDPTLDKVLKKAGIEKAKGLVAALPDDQDNLFLVISARGLNSKLRIAAKVIRPGAKEKMLKAGADETISPSQIGGLRIASVMIRPSVVTFLDTLLRGQGATRFEEVTLSDNSKLIGKKFQEAQEAEETGLSVIAIRKKNAEDYICNPRAEITMEAGDILVTLGEIKQKEEFIKKFN